MDINKEASELIGICKKLQKDDKLYSLAGNLSMRLENEKEIIITPSAMDYDILKVDDIIRINLSTGQHLGKRKPSIETPMHLEIYRFRTDISAVIHIHSQYATALACAKKELPVFTGALVGIGPIPVAPYATPGSKEMVDNIIKTLGKEGQAVFMYKHGLLVVGSSLKDALNRVYAIERASYIFLLSEIVGGVHPLTNKEIEGIKKVSANYGQADANSESKTYYN